MMSSHGSTSSRQAFRELLERAAAMHEELIAENEMLRSDASAQPVPIGGQVSIAFSDPPASGDMSGSLSLSGLPTKLPELAIEPSPEALQTLAVNALPEVHALDEKKRNDILGKFQELADESLFKMLSVATVLDEWLGVGPRLVSPEEVEFMPPSSADLAQKINCVRGRAALGDDLSQDVFFEIMVMESLDEILSEAEVEKVQSIRNMFARKDLASIVASTTATRTSRVESFAFSMEDDNESPDLQLRLKKIIDPLSFCVILLNAISMAVSTDHAPGWRGWDQIELFFTAFFLTEIGLKIWFGGLHEFVSGGEWKWNMADFVIVMFAVADAVITLFLGQVDSNIQTITLMRLVRLTRVARVIRLLHFEIFKELLLMIRGVLAGLRTLFWAIIILLFVIFCLALLMRQTVGVWCASDAQSKMHSYCTSGHLVEYGEQLFGTLGRSCFTVFRCLTEGCTSADGTPLVMHIFENGWYGSFMVLIYTLVYLAVTFGLFNLIMAVFVETTMESAKIDERRRRRARQMESVRVAKKLHALVVLFCQRVQLPEYQNSMKAGRSTWLTRSTSPSSSSTALGAPDLEASLDVKVTREMFASMVAVPEVEALLEDLEVQVSDHASLFDTLDANGDGCLDVKEISKGMMRLRGSAEKSDVVASLLSVRSMQESLRGFEGTVLPTLDALRRSQARLEVELRALRGPTRAAAQQEVDTRIRV